MLGERAGGWSLAGGGWSADGGTDGRRVGHSFTPHLRSVQVSASHPLVIVHFFLDLISNDGYLLLVLAVQTLKSLFHLRVLWDWPMFQWESCPTDYAVHNHTTNLMRGAAP